MSEPLRDESPEGATPDGAVPEPAGSGRREHALQSLLELARELTVAMDVYETSDLLLFNLMGQLGAARSALWLLPDDEAETRPVLVRCHGFHRPVIEAIGSACAPALLARFRSKPAPILSWALRQDLGAIEFDLARQAELALFAPLHARGEFLGWLALGPRVDGSAYGQADLEVLEAALGIVGVSFENVRLYNRARETNRRLRATNEYLSELDRLKTEFLNNVNHELRTPLAVVIATLECALSQGVGDAKIQELLDGSLLQSKKLNGMIENLLRFSELRNARLNFHIVTEDAGSVLSACVQERLPGVTAGLRELSYRRGDDRLHARFDRARLLQIVNELIDNAIKFNPRGARIDLRTARIEVEGQTWVQIEIVDDGPGIPADRMDSLFRSFEQVDGSATRTVGGLGVGLAFAHELAERMGCRLSAQSAIGEGSTFRLLLPAA
ncbi:MAG: sensor histidine kinase [Candidatus Eiseniibacteriota bacterium]